MRNSIRNLYQTALRKPIHVSFCLDYSGSMYGEGYNELVDALNSGIKKDIDECVLHLKWKHGLLYAFGYDPLLCECGSVMVYNYEKSSMGERKKVPI